MQERSYQPIITSHQMCRSCQTNSQEGIPRLIKLIIRQTHRRVCHLGIASTLGEVRRECWIIQGRQAVIQVSRNCVICNKQQKKAYQQPTALLPEARCTFSPPFSVFGLDIAGPFFRTRCPKSRLRSILGSQYLNHEMTIQRLSNRILKYRIGLIAHRKITFSASNLNYQKRIKKTSPLRIGNSLTQSAAIPSRRRAQRSPRFRCCKVKTRSRGVSNRPIQEEGQELGRRKIYLTYKLAPFRYIVLKLKFPALSTNVK